MASFCPAFSGNFSCFNTCINNFVICNAVAVTRPVFFNIFWIHLIPLTIKTKENIIRIGEKAKIKGFFMNKNFAQKFSVLLVLFLLLNSSFAFAFTHAQSFPQQVPEKIFLADDNPNPAVISARFACQTNSLSEQDAQNILDLLETGFTGEEIGAGTEPNEERDSIENSDIIVPLDDDSAVSISVPDEKIKVNEITHLTDKFIDGPFAYGIVLTDTLRVGRCNEIDEENCPVTGKRLKLRNSGVGIIADTKPIKEELSKFVPALRENALGDLTEEEYQQLTTEFQQQTNLNDEHFEQVEQRLADEDLEQVTVQTFKRQPLNLISNSVLTKNFDAYFETNCATSDCSISVYSLFDKYYNSWFSAEMVISSTAPMLLNGAGKLFGYLGRAGEASKGLSSLWPWQLKQVPLLQRLNTRLYNINDASTSARTMAEKLNIPIEQAESVFKNLGFDVGKGLPTLGDFRARRIVDLANKYPELSPILSKLREPTHGTGGMVLIKGGEFRKWFTEEFNAPDGIISKIKDPKAKKALYQFAKDLRGITRTQGTMFNLAEQKYKKILKDFPRGHPKEIEARINYSMEAIQAMRGFDNAFAMDIPASQIFKGEPYGLKNYFIRQEGIHHSFLPISESTGAMWNIEQKFLRDGHFGSTYSLQSVLEVDESGNILSKYLRNSGEQVKLSDLTPNNALEKLKSKVELSENNVIDLESMLKSDSPLDQYFTKGEASDWLYPEARYGSEGRNLILYEPNAKGEAISEGATIDDLRKSLPEYKELMIKTAKGENILVTPHNLDEIEKDVIGNVDIFEAHFTPSHKLSPEEFADIYTRDEMRYNVGFLGVRNGEELFQSVAEKGFGSRRYTSILDKAIAEQQEILKDYASLRGGAKWTFNTYGMWWVKKGAFLGEDFSAFRLPDSWKKISFSVGNANLYNDAFVDFFAQAGSDQGDMFVRILNHLPYDMVYDYISEQFEPTKNVYDFLTGRTGRDTVENVALYLTSSEDCSDCTISVAKPDALTISPAFHSGSPVEMFLVEDTVTEKAREKGSTLISFTRHMDLKGEISDDAERQGEINLRDGLVNKETCKDAVEELTYGYFPENADPSTIGLALSLTESLGYVAFGWSGILLTALQQTLLAPKLNDCVDVHGGYYTHVFAPAKSSAKDSSKLSTEAVSEQFDDFAGQVSSWFSDDENSYTNSQAEGLKKDVENFLNTNQKDKVVQGTVKTTGFAEGLSQAQELFMFWFKGEATPTEYRTEGQEVVTGTDGERIVFDLETGQIYVLNEDGSIGEILVEEEVASRLVSDNLPAAAKEIPNKYTLASLPGHENPIFEMNTSSRTFVLDSDLLDCIQLGVEEQTGIGFASNDLTEVFGTTLSIVTDTHPSVKVVPGEDLIVADGTPRQLVRGPAVKAVVKGNRETVLLDLDETPVGLMNSLQFENGSITFKPDSNQLIVWLKRNAKATISSEDVRDLRLNEESVINPENQCSENAFNLEALPIQGSDLAAAKVNAFNDSIEHLGPFQIFDTPTRRFVFYSDLENGVCTEKFKIINKETGEIEFDGPILPPVLTPDGLKITGEDGSEHNLDFSAPNGVPTITYNNFPPETISSAQGRNGAFWFDPETNSWYAENGQLIPLIEAFRNGSVTAAGPDGAVTATAGGNVLNIGQIGGQSGAFNLPSLPENIVMLLITITAMLSSIMLVRKRIIELR